MDRTCPARATGFSGARLQELEAESVRMTAEPAATVAQNVCIRMFNPLCRKSLAVAPDYDEIIRPARGMWGLGPSLGISEGEGGPPSSDVTMIRLKPPRRTRIATWILIVILWLSHSSPGWSQAKQTIVIRGHEQTLYIYGSPRADPVILSSGDGGWIHLAPHVAEFLSRRGFFVIGFDVRAYLAGFTAARSTLRTEDEPGDYKILAEFARTQNGRKPLLIGVSEGAGLSVLAATDPQTKAAIAGVVGLGLPDLSELGWRWKDVMIYLTHRTPDEPTFSVASIVDRVAPAPLAAIHSTRDEFVPVADIERILRGAKDPKRLWIIKASDHRFSDNLDEFDRRLLEAIAWVKTNAPH